MSGSPTAVAETLYWKGSTNNVWSGANNNWATDISGNTAAGNTPQSTSDVVLSANGALNKGMALAGNTEIKSLTIIDSAVTTLSGYTLTISGVSGATGITTGSGAAASGIYSNVALMGASQTVTVNRPNPFYFFGTLSSSGGLTKAGTGDLYLVGPASYPGKTTVSGGNLWVVTPNSLPNSGGLGSNVTVQDGASVILAAGGSGEFIGSQISAFASNGTWQGVSRLGIDTRDATTGPVVVGDLPAKPFGLLKVSANTLRLTGTNACTGVIQIVQGTLQAGSVNAMPNQAPVAISPGGVLDLNGFDQLAGTIGDDAFVMSGGLVALGGATLTTGNDNVTALFSGSITGSGNVIKSGTGTWILSGTNTYLGNTTASGGSLWAIKPVSLPNWDKVTVRKGTSLVVNAGGGGEFAEADLANLLSKATWESGSTLCVDTRNATNPFTLTNITGGINLIKNSNNTLVLTGSNAFTGLNEIRGGTLQSGTVNAMSWSSDVMVGEGATFDLNNFTQVIGSLGDDLGSGGAVTLGTAILITGYNGRDSSFSGVISGSGEVHKVGLGTWTLSGSNTYTGATAVYEGTLRVSATNVISSQSVVAVKAGAVFDLNGFMQWIGSLKDLGSGGSVVLGGAILVTGFDGYNTSFSGVISGTGEVRKVGFGTWTVSGSNTSSATGVYEGTLQAGAANVISPQTVLPIHSGAVFDLNGFDQSIASLTDGWGSGGSVTLGGATLTLGADNQSRTFSGSIRGTGKVIKVGTGTWTLSGTSTYSGVMQIDNGFVYAGASNNFNPQTAMKVGPNGYFHLNGSNQAIGSLADAPSGGGGTVFLSWGNTLTTGGDDTSTTFSGSMNGSGGLTKTGQGTFVINGFSSYAGVTTVNTGALAVTGTLNNNYSQMAVAFGAKLAVPGGSVSLWDLDNGGTVEVSTNGQLALGHSFTNTGMLRLTGSAQFQASQFTNNGVLDIMNWKGTLPSGFVNNGIILDRCKVKIDKAAIAGKDYTLTVMGYAGHSYQMQTSVSLADGSWTNIGSPVVGADSPITFTHPGGVGGDKRFYRVQVEPAL